MLIKSTHTPTHLVHDQKYRHKFLIIFQPNSSFKNIHKSDSFLVHRTALEISKCQLKQENIILKIY